MAMILALLPVSWAGFSPSFEWQYLSPSPVLSSACSKQRDYTKWKLRHYFIVSALRIERKEQRASKWTLTEVLSHEWNRTIFNRMLSVEIWKLFYFTLLYFSSGHNHLSRTLLLCITLSYFVLPYIISSIDTAS